MSILFIAGDFPPGIDDIARYLFNLTSSLEKKKDLTVLTVKKHGWKDFDKDSELKVIRSGNERGGLSSIISMHRAAARLASDKKIEHIIAGPWNPAGVTAMNLSLKTGIPYSLILFGDEIKRYIRKSVTAVRLKKIFSRSAKIFCISGRTAALLTPLSLPDDKIEIIYGGSNNIDGLTVDKAIIKEIRKNLGIGEDEKLVLSTGRLERKYAFDILIWAVYLLRQKNKSFKLLIIGDGPEEKKLRTIIEDLRIGDFVKIMHPDNRLGSYYALCDIYVQLGRSVKETKSAPLGISILEAIYLGKPVVISESCPLSEVIVDSETCFRVPPLKPVETAAALKKLLESGQSSSRAEEAARKKMLKKFSWENVVADILNAIRLK